MRLSYDSEGDVLNVIFDEHLRRAPKIAYELRDGFILYLAADSLKPIQLTAVNYRRLSEFPTFLVGFLQLLALRLIQRKKISGDQRDRFRSARQHFGELGLAGIKLKEEIRHRRFRAVENMRRDEIVLHPLGAQAMSNGGQINRSVFALALELMASGAAQLGGEQLFRVGGFLFAE